MVIFIRIICVFIKKVVNIIDKIGLLLVNILIVINWVDFVKIKNDIVLIIRGEKFVVCFMILKVMLILI